jgi:hypothetical protein
MRRKAAQDIPPAALLRWGRRHFPQRVALHQSRSLAGAWVIQFYGSAMSCCRAGKWCRARTGQRRYAARPIAAHRQNRCLHFLAARRIRGQRRGAEPYIVTT